MRPVTVTASGAGPSDYLRFNYLQPNFKIGFGMVVTGTVNYTVQHTFDDPQDFDGTTDFNTNATWFDHDTVVAQTANQDGNYFFPFQAARININSGAGSVTGTFIQGAED